MKQLDINKLNPGDLFRFGDLEQQWGSLYLCLWCVPSARFVDFGYSRLGAETFTVITAEWWHRKFVYVIDDSSEEQT